MSSRPLALVVLLAGCPPPIATEDTGEPQPGSSTSTSSASDSASETGGTPTTGGAETTTGTVTTDTTLGLASSGESSTSTASTTSTASSSGDTSSTSRGDTSSSGPGVEPPPGCDVAEIHVGELVVTDATDQDSLKCIVEVTGRLKIRDTTTLVSFPGLVNLARVGDDVEIFDNLALTDLDGLAGLERVDGGPFGELILSHNPALTDLTGLAALRHVDAVNVFDCDALTDLTGLTGTIAGILKPSWQLGIIGCDGLTSLTGLAGLENFAGRLYLAKNTALADISALATALGPALTDISILDNPALVDLHGLEAVVSTELLHVMNNDALVDLMGLDSLTTVEPHGFLLEGNAQLVTLDGLDALTTVNDLVIEDNPGLVSLAALADLTQVPSSLMLGRCDGAGNDSLVDLEGLQHLEQLGALQIHENDALTSIAALPGDIGLEGVLAFNNEKLPTTMLADYVADAGVVKSSVLCNNAGAPAQCECIVWQD